MPARLMYCKFWPVSRAVGSNAKYKGRFPPERFACCACPAVEIPSRYIGLLIGTLVSFLVHFVHCKVQWYVSLPCCAYERVLHNPLRVGKQTDLKNTSHKIRYPAAAAAHSPV